jgi:hypothetical protein
VKFEKAITYALVDSVFFVRQSIKQLLSHFGESKKRLPEWKPEDLHNPKYLDHVLRNECTNTFTKLQTIIIQYLPKVWKRARARERTLWRLAFFLGDPRNPIFVGSR